MTTSAKDLRKLADLLGRSAKTTKTAAMCMNGSRFEDMAEAAEQVEAAASKTRDVADATGPTHPLRYFGKR